MEEQDQSGRLSSRMSSTDSDYSLDRDWYSCRELDVDVEPEKFSTSDEFWIYFEMALLGDDLQIRAFIERHAAEDISFWSAALLVAVELEDADVLRIFICHAPVHLQKLLYCARDDSGYTTLHKAVLKRKFDTIKLLLTGCDLFTTGVALQSSKEEWVLNYLHARTLTGSTALHFAVLKKDYHAVDYLANIYDRYTSSSHHGVDHFLDNFWMTPLHYAVLGKSERIVKQLLCCKAYATHVNARDWSMRTALHVACCCSYSSYDSDNQSLLAVIETLLDSSLVDVNALDCCKFTPLHWAVFVRAVDVVRLILSRVRTRTIRTTEEDYDGRTVLHSAYDSSRSDPFIGFMSSSPTLQASSASLKDTEFSKRGRDVERLLLTDLWLKGEVERLYRDRQVYVDAANAILVGAALIAGVTFGGWLQPPFGDDSQAAHRSVRIFWTFNSLSFFFAVASVMAGAAAVFPMANRYIGDVVDRVRDWLALTSFLLLVSVVSVLIAFSAAGFASNRHIPGLIVNMTVSTAIGSFVCGWIGLFFLHAICHNRPEWLSYASYCFQKVYNSSDLLDIPRLKYHRMSDTKLRDRAVYEEELCRNFERVYNMSLLLGVGQWQQMRSRKAMKRGYKYNLQARMQEAFDRTYCNLELACQSSTSKPSQILQCVNQVSPYGLRRATQRESFIPAAEKGPWGVDEVLEDTVIQIVTAQGGRGLLHLFMNLQTNTCRDLCIRNNRTDFLLLATGHT